MRLRSLAFALALGSAGCMDFEGVEGERKLSTHVADWREELIYQMMTDRFANGDLANDYGVHKDAPGRYHGGDWRGTEEHLGYLENLGVTAIWISPLFKNV